MDGRKAAIYTAGGYAQHKTFIVRYLFIYYIIVHEVQNTHIQRKIGLKNIKSNHKITIGPYT